MNDQLRESKQIFVFGSNTQGRHGKGAAKEALEKHGAIYGQARGLQGNSYGIVTKELRNGYLPVTLNELFGEVNRFIVAARLQPHLTFNVTKVGCGLAGFREAEVKPMFKGAPENCILPEGWRE